MPIISAMTELDAVNEMLMSIGQASVDTLAVTGIRDASIAQVSPYGDAVAPDVQDVVPAKLAEFTGIVVGANDFRLNRPFFHTGVYSFQVYGYAGQARISETGGPGSPAGSLNSQLGLNRVS